MEMENTVLGFWSIKKVAKDGTIKMRRIVANARCIVIDKMSITLSMIV